MDLLIFGTSLGAFIAAIIAAVRVYRLDQRLEKLERAGILITSDKAHAPKAGHLSRRELAKLIEKKAAERAGV